MESNKIATNNKLENEIIEDELQLSLEKICGFLYNGVTNKTLSIQENEYTCDGINCSTCPFNNVETFKDFLEVFRRDRGYHNYCFDK